MIVHGSNLSGLHEYIPRDVITSELGGEGVAYKPDEWIEMLKLVFAGLLFVQRLDRLNNNVLIFVVAHPRNESFRVCSIYVIQSVISSMWERISFQEISLPSHKVQIEFRVWNFSFFSKYSYLLLERMIYQEVNIYVYKVCR